MLAELLQEHLVEVKQQLAVLIFVLAPNWHPHDLATMPFSQLLLQLQEVFDAFYDAKASFGGYVQLWYCEVSSNSNTILFRSLRKLSLYEGIINFGQDYSTSCSNGIKRRLTMVSKKGSSLV